MTAPADLRGRQADAFSAMLESLTGCRVVDVTPQIEAFRVVNGRAVEALRFIPVTKD